MICVSAGEQQFICASMLTAACPMIPLYPAAMQSIITCEASQSRRSQRHTSPCPYLESASRDPIQQPWGVALGSTSMRTRACHLSLSMLLRIQCEQSWQEKTESKTVIVEPKPVQEAAPPKFMRSLSPMPAEASRVARVNIAACDHMPCRPEAYAPLRGRRGYQHSSPFVPSSGQLFCIQVKRLWLCSCRPSQL